MIGFTSIYPEVRVTPNGWRNDAAKVDLALVYVPDPAALATLADAWLDARKAISKFEADEARMVDYTDAILGELADDKPVGRVLAKVLRAVEQRDVSAPTEPRVVEREGLTDEASRLAFFKRMPIAATAAALFALSSLTYNSGELLPKS